MSQDIQGNHNNYLTNNKFDIDKFKNTDPADEEVKLRSLDAVLNDPNLIKMEKKRN